MKKALIYLRTSSEKQIDNTSLDTQEEICRSYCQREGFEVIDIQKHEAVSAKGDNIKRIAELLEYCKVNQGKFEVLIVYKLDRFARDTEKHLWLRSELLKLGVVLRSATEKIDESSQGRFLETILAAVAQLDNDVRKERVKIAMWRRVEEGLWPWQPPLGYYRQKAAGTRLTVSEWDLSCSQAIIDIFRFFSTGVYTMRNLGSMMNKRKIQNWQGKTIKFPPQLIQKTLNNPFYIGLLKGQDGKLHKGQHKPLIEISLWDRCQETLNKRSNNAINKRVFDNPDFPLRRFAVCNYCSQPMTAGWSKGKMGKHYGYYYCHNKECSKYGEMVSRDGFHNEFLDYIKQIKPKEEFIELFKEIFIDRYKERQLEIKGEYLRKLEAIKKLEQDQQWLIEKGKKGVISDVMLQKQLEETEQKITLAKMELTETHGEELEVNILLNYALAFIRTPETAWFEANSEAKLKYQRLIFPSGVVYNFSGFSNPELGLPFQLINTFAAKRTTNVTPERFELSIFWMKTRCPRPLDDGANK